MAKKSQVVAVLEGRLNLLKADEANRLKAYNNVGAQVSMLEDLLKIIKAAGVGAANARNRKSRGVVRQTTVETFNKLAAVAAGEQDHT